ncbi:MAG TPA: hypothetical protein VF580_01600 [Thermoanaerobaculia bacterium]
MEVTSRGGPSADVAAGAKIAVVACLLFILVKLPLLVLAALRARIVMDEFFQGAISIVVPDGFYHGYDPIKTVLYAYVFDVARRVTHDAASLMLAARVEGLVLALIVAFLVGWMGKRLGRTTPETLFAVAVLLSFSNFMERSFRVRSDSVSVFFIAGAMTAATWPGASAAAVSGVLAGAAFLSTQKAAFAVAALGIGWVSGALRPASKTRAYGEALAFAAGFALAVLGYAAWFGGFGTGALAVVRMVFLSPLDFAARSLTYYSGLELYVTQTLERNVLPYALCAAGVLLATLRIRELSDAARRLLIVALVVPPCVFFGVQTWPYVFVLPIVVLAVFSPEVPRFVARRAPGLAAPVLLILLAGLAFSLARNVRYLRASNEDQLSIVRVVENLLGPEDRYLDGTWMIATRRHAGKIWWDAQGIRAIVESANRGDFTELDAAFAEQPKVVILNYRTQTLGPLLARYVVRSYVRAAPNALLSGIQIDGTGEVLFENRWAGRYRLYDAKGRLRDAAFRLDGDVVVGDVLVGLGPHRLALRDSTGPAFLLPAGLSLPGSLPETRPPEDVFRGVYD